MSDDIGTRATAAAVHGIIVTAFFMILYLVIFGTFSPNGVAAAFLAATFTELLREFTGINSKTITKLLFEKDK